MRTPCQSPGKVAIDSRRAVGSGVQTGGGAGRTALGSASPALFQA
jgi:hypothetical protein